MNLSSGWAPAKSVISQRKRKYGRNGKARMKEVRRNATFVAERIFCSKIYEKQRDSHSSMPRRYRWRRTLIMSDRDHVTTVGHWRGLSRQIWWGYSPLFSINPPCFLLLLIVFRLIYTVDWNFWYRWSVKDPMIGNRLR